MFHFLSENFILNIFTAINTSSVTFEMHAEMHVKHTVTDNTI